MFKRLLYLWLLALPVQAAPLTVLASIEPLALLVRDIGGERVQASALLSAGSSPHHFALRPSQRARIESADLIFWAGPDLERPLAALLARRPADTVLALQPEPTGHESHLWLSPARVREVAGRLQAALARLDPAGAAYYQARLSQTLSALQDEDARLQQQLAPYSHVPLLLDHDFLDAFWPALDLPAPLVVRQHPEHAPGTAHVAAMSERLSALPAVCYLREDGAPADALALAVLRNTPQVTRYVSVLDALGHQGYAGYLASLGDALAECLQSAEALAAGKKKP